MIRLALLFLAFNAVVWGYTSGFMPAQNLIACLLNLGAAVGVDLINSAWHRRAA